MNKTDCRQARQLMSLKVDATPSAGSGQGLAEIDEWRLRRHLDTCADCAEQWASLRLLVEELETAPVVAPPADFVARVMARACPGLAEGVTATAPQSASASRKGLSLAIAAVLLGAVCIGLVTMLGAMLGLFNLPYLALAVNDALRWGAALSAPLAFPRAILIACADAGEALLSSPWPVLASGCSALSAALLLAWVYVLLHWRGVPLGQFANGGTSGNGSAMGR